MGGGGEERGRGKGELFKYIFVVNVVMMMIMMAVIYNAVQVQETSVSGTSLAMSRTTCCTTISWGTPAACTW